MFVLARAQLAGEPPAISVTVITCLLERAVLITGSPASRTTEAAITRAKRIFLTHRYYVDQFLQLERTSR
jgi:hypothetical protein